MDEEQFTTAWWLRRGGRFLRPEELRAQVAGLAAATWHAAAVFDGEPLLRLDGRQERARRAA